MRQVNPFFAARLQRRAGRRSEPYKPVHAKLPYIPINEKQGRFPSLRAARIPCNRLALETEL